MTPEATPEVTPEITPEVTPEVTPEATPEITEEPDHDDSDNPSIDENNEEINSSENEQLPQISIFDPAISKIGFLRVGQVGIIGEQIEWIVTVSNTGSIVGQNFGLCLPERLAKIIDITE